MTSDDELAPRGGSTWALASVSALLLMAVVVQGVLAAREAPGEESAVGVLALGFMAFVCLAMHMVASRRSMALGAVGFTGLAISVGLMAGLALAEPASASPLSTTLLLLNAVGLLLSAAAAAARRSATRTLPSGTERSVSTEEATLPVSLVRLHVSRSLILVGLLLGPVVWLLASGPRGNAATNFILATLLFCWVFALAFFVIWPMLSEESDRFRLESRLEAEAGRARRRFARLRSRQLG